jgi:hypothetical protein
MSVAGLRVKEGSTAIAAVSSATASSVMVVSGQAAIFAESQVTPTNGYITASGLTAISALSTTSASGVILWIDNAADDNTWADTSPTTNTWANTSDNDNLWEAA